MQAATMDSPASRTAALPPDRACARTPFGGLVAQLTRLMGEARYDTEHRKLTIRRADLDRLAPGELFAVEIYCPSDGRQAQLYVDYVHQITATGATFRGRGLRPLTIAGLQRAIRDAKRLPRGRRPRIALLATVVVVCDWGRLPRGVIGAVVEVLDSEHVLVEFAGTDGVAWAIEPVPIAHLRVVALAADEMRAFIQAAAPVTDLDIKGLAEDGRA